MFRRAVKFTGIALGSITVHFHCYEKTSKKNNLKEVGLNLAVRVRGFSLWLLRSVDVSGL